MSGQPLHQPCPQRSWEQSSSRTHTGTGCWWLGLKALEKQEEAQRLTPCGENELAMRRCLRVMLSAGGWLQRS